jgi:hypothetical protein
MSSRCALLVGLVIAALAPGGAPVRAQTGVAGIGLRNCHLTVDFLDERDGARMYREGWLPKGQKLATPSGWPPSGPGSASLTIWVFDCAGTAVDGRPAGAAMLSLTGIQIEDRVYAVAPTHWDNYMVWAQTNNAVLARTLRAVGLPVVTVRRMRFIWRAGGNLTTVEVPWSASPYGLSIRGLIDDIPHAHDNTFQHGATAGAGPRLELVVDPLVPRDKFCVPAIQSDCMRITTAPGSAMARFLGHAEYTLGADHELIARAQLNVIGG